MPQAETMRLTTARLLIRPFRPEDITDGYVAALNDVDVVQYTEARHQTWDHDKAEAYVRAYNGKGQSILLGLFRRESEQHLGNILLHPEPRHRRVEMSFMVWDKRHWKQGYATEAVCAVAEACVRLLGAHKLTAGYYAPHQASAHVLERAGFHVEAVLRQHYVYEDRYVDGIRVARWQNDTVP